MESGTAALIPSVPLRTATFDDVADLAHPADIGIGNALPIGAAIAIGIEPPRGLAQLIEDPAVRTTFDSLYQHHVESIGIMRQAAACTDGVIQFDVSGYDLDGYNKFIPYYLFPEATYTVALTRAPQRTKISVGSNPWAPRPRRHNIATICERYGGGGHAVVGAISFAPDEVEKARKAMAQIVEELQAG